jgi:hypothetical protein
MAKIAVSEEFVAYAVIGRAGAWGNISYIVSNTVCLAGISHAKQVKAGFSGDRRLDCDRADDTS